jgi:hypothetical protein
VQTSDIGRPLWRDPPPTPCAANVRSLALFVVVEGFPIVNDTTLQVANALLDDAEQNDQMGNKFGKYEDII